MQPGWGAWQGSVPSAWCPSRSRCVSPAVGVCHPWSVCAVGAVPGLGYPPGQPQASSPAFAVLLWPLVVEAVTAQLTPGAVSLGTGEWSWGIRVSQPPLLLPAAGQEHCPCPGEAAGQREVRPRGPGYGVGQHACLPACLPACLGLAPALESQEQFAEPGGVPQTVPAHSRSAGRAGRLQAGCRQVPHHLAGGGGVTLEWSWQTPHCCGARAAATAGDLPCPWP